jgi:phage protein D
MKVVNLNKARKAKVRATERTAADANATKFGRSKAEKALEAARAAKAARDLDGHRQE